MMIRAIAAGLAVSVLMGLLFLFVPADQARRSQRGAPTPETIVSNFPAQPSTKESVAKVEAANLWGIASPQAAAAKEKITGKIVGAVSTRDTKYVLLQVGKQTPVEAKIGDVLPIELEPFAGARIIEIHADRVKVQKNGETYVMSISN